MLLGLFLTLTSCHILSTEGLHQQPTRLVRLFLVLVALLLLYESLSISIQKSLAILGDGNVHKIQLGNLDLLVKWTGLNVRT